MFKKLLNKKEKEKQNQSRRDDEKRKLGEVCDRKETHRRDQGC